MRTHAAFVIVSDSARAVHSPYCVHEAPAPARTLKTGHGSFSATTRGTIANRTQHTRFVRDSLTSACPWCGTVVMKLAATARIRPTTAVYSTSLS